MDFRGGNRDITWDYHGRGIPGLAVPAYSRHPRKFMAKPNSRKNGAIWRWGRWLLLSLLVPGLAIGGFALYLVVVDNFHVVSPGVVYRSSQMSGAALTRTIKEHGIKSVLNLRGPGPTQDWYIAEIEAARASGVEHFDIPLSATRELTDEQLEALMDILHRAPKPLLIHCKSGSDRTGLAGALYLYGIEGQPARLANRQLTALYGHLPQVIWSETIAMDNSFWRYVTNHLQPGEAPAASSKPVASEAGVSLVRSPAP